MKNFASTVILVPSYPPRTTTPPFPKSTAAQRSNLNPQPLREKSMIRLTELVCKENPLNRQQSGHRLTLTHISSSRTLKGVSSSPVTSATPMLTRKSGSKFTTGSCTPFNSPTCESKLRFPSNAVYGLGQIDNCLLRNP